MLFINNNDIKQGLPQKAFVKSIQLSTGAINHLSSVENKICVSGEDGAVRFYDYQFRIEGWFEDLNSGKWDKDDTSSVLGYSLCIPTNALP